MAYNIVGTLNTRSPNLIGRLSDNGELQAVITSQGGITKGGVAQYDTINDFPEVGNATTLYVDISTMQCYIWVNDDYGMIAGGGTGTIESISVNGIVITPIDNNVNIGFGSDFNVSSQGVVSLLKANAVEQDNTRPITAAAVYTEVGNIDALLQTI